MRDLELWKLATSCSEDQKKADEDMFQDRCVTYRVRPDVVVVDVVLRFG